MTRKQDLEALRDKVAAGVEPTATHVMDAFQFVGGIGVYALQVLPAYKGSLDAAKALHDAVLPGWSPLIVKRLTSNGWHVAVRIAYHDGFEAWSCDNKSPNNPARAWLLAILAALIKMEIDK